MTKIKDIYSYKTINHDTDTGIKLEHPKEETRVLTLQVVSESFKAI